MIQLTGTCLITSQQAEYQQDSQQNTLMSYCSAENTGASHGLKNYGATPLLYDIATIQAIYGAITTTCTGNTVYGFNSNTDHSAYQFSSQVVTPIIAIWDSAGNDTLNFSGYSQNGYISLIAGSFSNIGGLTKNVAVAYGSHIENAVGGSGNNTLIGQVFSTSIGVSNSIDYFKINAASNWMLNELNNGVAKVRVIQEISLTLTNLSSTDIQWGATR
jgi:serralysin